MLTESAEGSWRRADLDRLDVGEHGLDEGPAGEPGGHEAQHGPSTARAHGLPINWALLGPHNESGTARHDAVRPGAG